jgi:hypothetical protein
MYYAATAATPPTCGKPEVDEMRILSHWCEQRRKKGCSIIYLAENWEESVGRLVRELTSILGTPAELTLPTLPIVDPVSTSGLVEVEPASEITLPVPVRPRRIKLKPMSI